MSLKKQNPDFAARLQGVTHHYGKTVALDDVTLDIPAGIKAGLIGPDGVGKSTLLALMAGVRKIQNGSIQVLGNDIKESSVRSSVCRRIAYMPQGLGRNLYPPLSVLENIEFFGRLFGLPGKERAWRIEELLESTGLTPFADRPAGKLSGGMKQKLGLCCALIHDPDLIILDEPTTGVDPLSRRQFWELMGRIQARRVGMSIIIATAYMEEAERFDWLVAMNDGDVISTGSPDDFLAQSGAASLEEAFVSFLPKDEREGHTALVIPTRKEVAGEIAIEANDLTKRFDGFTAVDHVSFRIEEGEIFGFLGSNGCGKTTTMKMLTGLLPVTEGEAYLFGKSVDAGDIKIRQRVGYMSQSFSLYNELTVRQNLELHARLFNIKGNRVEERTRDMLERFDLRKVEHELAEKLPLGIKQRLSLAVALIHEPEVLILDEPTSGVDPLARDDFWSHLVRLSREEGVTIFISTHFMNEGERCDRISLMHAGKVLAQGVPQDLVRESGKADLEGTFISLLEEETGDSLEVPEAERLDDYTLKRNNNGGSRGRDDTGFSFRRSWAYALLEALELRRDPIRLAFAVLGPLLLLVVFGYGISFDVEDLSYAVLDLDRTPESREYLDNFVGSRYLSERSPITNHDELEHRLRSGELRLAIEIPPGFGKDLKSGNSPVVGVWLDGAMPFRAETSRGYVQGVHARYLEYLSESEAGYAIPSDAVDIVARYIYNQDFKSVFAMVPGIIMLLLVFIPAIMTAVGVAREKELGSISNFYSTPVTRLEFLLGKQSPYVVVAMINFITLVVLSYLVFNVSVKGSFIALAVGTFLYVITTTGFGMVVSTFVKSQIAAIFAAAIITTVPAINFSGLFTPVSSLSGGAKIFGTFFPYGYFQQVIVGIFTKAFTFGQLVGNNIALIVLIVAYTALSYFLLKPQEK